MFGVMGQTEVKERKDGTNVRVKVESTVLEGRGTAAGLLDLSLMRGGAFKVKLATTDGDIGFAATLANHFRGALRGSCYVHAVRSLYEYLGGVNRRVTQHVRDLGGAKAPLKTTDPRITSMLEARTGSDSDGCENMGEMTKANVSVLCRSRVDARRRGL